jgi:glucan phosphoethanolaminetransferase (alkaline phosphatase superfamily)
MYSTQEGITRVLLFYALSGAGFEGVAVGHPLDGVVLQTSLHFLMLYFSILLPCVDLTGVSAPSVCNVARCSFNIQYFITCFGLNGHLQVYRLLYCRTLMLTVMRLLSLVVILFLIMWVTRRCFPVMCVAAF